MSVVNVVVLLVAIGLGRTFPLPTIILVVIYCSIVLGITINKYNTAKAHGDDVKPLKKTLWGSAISVGLLLILLGVFIALAGGFQPKSSSVMQTPTELARLGAEQAKASATFPYELDDVTTFTDITSEGNAIQYHYIIHDGDTSNLTDDALRSVVQPTACASTGTKSLLGRGVELQYLYSVKETGQQYSFTITNSDCR